MNLLKALSTISGMTLLSRVLAFVRDILIARIFGAGMATDAFFVAFKLPNMLRRLFAEGAFSQAFVPIFSEYKNRRGNAETKLMLDHVTTLLALILFVVTLIGIIAAPILVYISAPGFVATPDKFKLTVQLLQISFPYIFFISLVSVAAGILNTYNKFWVPAFTPVLMNICFIAAALWLAPYCNPPILALAIAVFVAGVVQLLFQIPFLNKIGMMPRFNINFQDEGVRRILKQMGPAIFGVSVSQISLLINTVFASFMIAGSVSWLYYADRLMEFPSGLIGVALGTILLPSLSKLHSNGDSQEYSKILDWGLRLIFMLTLPAALALGLIAVPLLATFFQYGAFGVNDVQMTRNALVGYSVGLIGILSVKVLAPAFYAQQNIRTPVKVAIVTLLVTQVLNLIFFLFVESLQHAGLALSISIGACFNSILLYYLLLKHKIYQPQPGWFKFLAKLLAALILLSLTLWFGMGTEQSWLVRTGWARIIHLSWLIAAGITVYFTTLWVLGFRLRDFSRHGVN
jgi:putative peptidoglycan lipid II flippase